MSQRPANQPLRSSRALEVRAREAVERAITNDGCDRVLIVYEKADRVSRTVPAARVYGEDSNGDPKKLEVLR